MVTIVDVLGAMVEAQLKAAEWEAEFQAVFNAPLKLAAEVQQFLAMPPDPSTGSGRAAMAPDQHETMVGHARRMQSMMGGLMSTDTSPEQMGGGANVPTPGG